MNSLLSQTRVSKVGLGTPRDGVPFLPLTVESFCLPCLSPPQEYRVVLSPFFWVRKTVDVPRDPSAVVLSFWVHNFCSSIPIVVPVCTPEQRVAGPSVFG